MKRILTTLVAVLGLGTAAFSQTANPLTKGNTEFGFMIGLNSATIVDNNSNKHADYKNGLGLAFSAEYYFSDRWGIKARAQYDQKGWANDYITTPSGDLSTNYSSTYITVPVMANWHFGKTRNWYLNFGPYVGFLLSAKTTNGNYDVKPLFNSVDAGIDFGIGIKFPVADKTKIFLELGGQGGLANVAAVIPTNNNNFQNSVSNFRVGINF